MHTRVIPTYQSYPLIHQSGTNPNTKHLYFDTYYEPLSGHPKAYKLKWWLCFLCRPRNHCRFDHKYEKKQNVQTLTKSVRRLVQSFLASSFNKTTRLLCDLMLNTHWPPPFTSSENTTSYHLILSGFDMEQQANSMKLFVQSYMIVYGSRMLLVMLMNSILIPQWANL